MRTWSDADLDAIDGADALHLSWRRRNGTWTEPLSLWFVRHGADLYLRSPRGALATWYRSLVRTDAARIRIGEIVHDVILAPPGHDDLPALDTAYRDKYRRYPLSCVDRVTSPRARVTTIRLAPRRDRAGQAVIQAAGSAPGRSMAAP